MDKNQSLLSKGSYGIVYLDKSTQNVNKYIYLYDDRNTFIENNIKEIFFYCLVAFGYFEHIPPSIPKIKSIIIKQNYSMINMNNYGVTINRINSSSKTTKYIFDLILSIHFLHRYNFSHGDIKPTNILVKDEQLYLIDFGSICYNHKINIEKFNHRCTLHYVSPEECSNNKFYISNDIWSLGCVIFEHLTNKKFLYLLLKECNIDKYKIDEMLEDTVEYVKPYKFLANIYSKTTQEVVDKIIDKYVYYSSKNIYYEYNYIIKKCLCIDYNRRIKSTELLNNKIFSSYLSTYTETSKISIDNLLSYQFTHNSLVNEYKNFYIYLYKTITQLINKNIITNIDENQSENISYLMLKIIIYNESFNIENNKEMYITLLKRFFSNAPSIIKELKLKNIF